MFNMLKSYVRIKFREMAFKVPTLKRKKIDLFSGLPRFKWEHVQIEDEI